MTLALGKLGEYERVCIAAGIRAELVSMYIYVAHNHHFSMMFLELKATPFFFFF